MQALQVKAIKKRARYYHSQIDMEIIERGTHYKDLPDTYVIFICDFDPFGEKKYCYTQMKKCREFPKVDMSDGENTIFLSTKGTNGEEVPESLVNFLKYVGAPLRESEEDFQDDFVKKLQESVHKVKASREMGAKYMSFQQIMEDMTELAREEAKAEGKAEGRAEGRAELLTCLVKKKLDKGMSAEEIAGVLEEGVDIIEDIVKKLQSE